MITFSRHTDILSEIDIINFIFLIPQCADYILLITFQIQKIPSLISYKTLWINTVIQIPNSFSSVC